MPKFFNFLTTLLIVFITLIFAQPTFAQTATPSPAPSPAPAPEDSVNSENYRAPEHADYTFRMILGSGVGCGIIGTSLISGGKCTYENQTGQAKVATRLPNGGALGGINSVMVAMYDSPPASTTTYLANFGTNLGLMGPPVYAQVGGSGIGGSGNGVIEPILNLWTWSRNITYLFFIIIFMAVGLMIMFRQKINPQTVVTAQQALPGLVIGLILVTFSYFFAALIVDTSFIGMRLVAFVFEPAQSGLPNIVTSPTEAATQSNIFQLFGPTIFNFQALGSKVVGPIVDQLIAVENFDVTNIFNPVNLLLPVLLGEGLIGGSIGLILSLVIMIGLLIQMLRLIWGLISAYITILVTTIGGPFIILASSLPGRGGIMSLWWKTLLANALIFPAVFAVFLFAGVILGSNDPINQTLPLFAGLDTDLLRGIIGYGILLSTPSIPGSIKSAFGVKDLREVTAAALAGFAGGGGAVTDGGSKGYGLAARGTGFSTMQEGYARAAMDDQRGSYTSAGPWKRRLINVAPRPH